MADTAWRQGRPAETDTGLMQVLLSFLTQGGQLFGAYRWSENPLTLTHVRWQGTTQRATLEAYRQPEVEDAISQEERNIWVQIALQMPIVQGGPSGGEAPWLPISANQEQVSSWVGILRQARRAPRSQGSAPFASSLPSAPQLTGYDLGASQPWPAPGTSNYPPSSQAPMGGANGWRAGLGGQVGKSMPRESVPSMPRRPFGRPPAPMPSSAPIPPMPPIPPSPPPLSPTPEGPLSTPSTVFGDSAQWTGNLPRSYVLGQEVTALPCVEVELPMLLEGPASADYRRDFSRDVALHFGRAVRTIPQVREARGWMRGERLVLAARFVFPGSGREPTRAELEGAAQILADVLAQRTLPYSRLGFADPGEWMQGAPLPE